MKLSKLFMIALLAGTLGVIGCDTAESTGNDAGTGGAGGAGGTGGAGGNGAGGTGGTTAPVTSCDAICSGPCVFFGFDPNSADCQSNCENVPEGNLGSDNCGSEMAAWAECANENNVCPASLLPEDLIDASTACPALFSEWDTCNI